ncbi:exopolysaccharide biosynthesis protein [Synergistales bacterium]|nr:exopolysaccharide biosynthesis protein [Synergistales bacterium]
MSNVKILVCAHKKGEYVRSDGVFTPVHGGRALSQADLGIQGDDTGDNISRKNPNYCELTVLYWAWKNLRNVDYIGLNHYRRYFLYKDIPVRNMITRTPDEYIYKMSDTSFEPEKHMNGYDIIMPKPWSLSYSPAVQYCLVHSRTDYAALRTIVKQSSPDYYDAFINTMEGQNKISYGNMFITRREIFDDYCSWIFPLLSNLEIKIADRVKGYDTYQARIYGFLSERLMNVYVLKNKLKVKYHPVVFLSNDGAAADRPLLKLLADRARYGALFALDGLMFKKGGVLHTV